MHILVLIGLQCTKIDRLIRRKIIKIVAKRRQILRLKCTKFDFGPLRELTALPHTPWGGRGWRRREGGEGEGGGEGGEIAARFWQVCAYVWPDETNEHQV